MISACDHVNKVVFSTHLQYVIGKYKRLATRAADYKYIGFCHIPDQNQSYR